MEPLQQSHCTVFEGTRRIATGTMYEVASHAKAAVDRGGSVLVFDDETGEPIELDFRGTPEDVLGRLVLPGAADEQAGARGRGRPKLGVVAREVTLLPRHWEWLNEQPGGASVALRKLVEDARRCSAPRDRRRKAQEAAYRFLSAMAGNLPGFEEATRALFGDDSERFDRHSDPWPADVRDHARHLAQIAFLAAAES